MWEECGSRSEVAFGACDCGACDTNAWRHVFWLCLFVTRVKSVWVGLGGFLSSLQSGICRNIPHRKHSCFNAPLKHTQKGVIRCSHKSDAEEGVFAAQAGRARVAPCRTCAGFQQVAGKRANRQGAILSARLRSALMPFPKHFLINNNKTKRFYQKHDQH